MRTLRAAMLALAALFAASRPALAQELTTVHVASVSNDTCSAILYGMKLGLFAKAGLNVDFQPAKYKWIDRSFPAQEMISPLAPKPRK